MRLVERLELLGAKEVVREPPRPPYGTEKRMPRIGICSRVRPLISRGMIHLLEEYDVRQWEEEALMQPDAAQSLDLLLICARSTLMILLENACACRTVGVPLVFISEGWLESEAAAREAGLKGYLGPDCDLPHLKDAVRIVLDGGFYHHPCGSPARPIGPLTNRQLQVLELIGRGYTDHEMAANLGIAEATVRHHLDALISKLGVSRRSELIAMAALGGLNPPE